MEPAHTNPDGYTQWDRLPIAYPRLHEGVRGDGQIDCLMRCVARIEPYELACRTINDRGPDHASTQRALAGLADDYLARRQAWIESHRESSTRNWQSTGPLLPLTVVICGVIGPLSLAALVATDARLESLRWWPLALIVAPIMIPLALCAITAVVAAAAPRTTPGRALRDRCCPDCAERLKGVRPAIDPTLIEGVFVGPRACSRCRRPWPLVPPPPPATADPSPYSRP